MASTVATIINGVTVGAVASNSSNVSKLTFTAGSTKFALQAVYTPAAQNVAAPVIRYAQSIDDLTANDTTVALLRTTSKILQLPPMTLGAKQLSTEVEAIRGTVLIVWTEDSVSGSATLTVKSIEYP